MPIVSGHPNGNCALNVIVIAACDAIFQRKLDQDKEAQAQWLSLFKKAKLIATTADWNNLKDFLSHQTSYLSQLNLQLQLASALRSLYIELVNKNKDSFLETTQGAFIGAFYSFAEEELTLGIEENPDDIYIKSFDVKEYFKGIYLQFKNDLINLNPANRKKINKQLEEDWKNFVHIPFLDYIAQDGIWLGDIELSKLLLELGFNFQLESFNGAITKLTNHPNKPPLTFLHQNFHWYCQVNSAPTRSNQGFSSFSDTIDELGLLRHGKPGEGQLFVLANENVLNFWHPCIQFIPTFSPIGHPFSHATIGLFLDYKTTHPGMWYFEFKHYTSNLLQSTVSSAANKTFETLDLISDFVEFFDFYQTHQTKKNSNYSEFMRYLIDKNTSWDEVIVAANKFIIKSKIAGDGEKATLFLVTVQKFLWQLDKRPNSLQASWQAGYHAMKYFALRRAEKGAEISEIMRQMDEFSTGSNSLSLFNHLKTALQFYKGLEGNFDGKEFFSTIQKYSTFPVLEKGVTSKDLTTFFSANGELINSKMYGWSFDDYIATVGNSLDAVISIWEMTVNTVPSLQNWVAAMKFAQTYIATKANIPPEQKNSFLSACQDRICFSLTPRVQPDNLQRCWNAGVVSLSAQQECAKDKEIKPSYNKAWRIFSVYIPEEKMLSTMEVQFKEIYNKAENFSELCKQTRAYKFSPSDFHSTSTNQTSPASNNNNNNSKSEKEEATLSNT